MKKFIRYTLIFCLFWLLPGILLEIMLRRIPNPYTFKKELFNRKAGAVKTLVIGSSVADYGINPAFLGDSAYNLAISGEWFKYNLASLKQHIDRMHHLKTVLLGVCYQALWIDDDFQGVTPDPPNILGKAEQRIYRGISFDRNPRYGIECIQNIMTAKEKWLKHYVAHQPTVHCDSLGFDHSDALSERKDDWLEKWEHLIERHKANLQSADGKEVYRRNCFCVEKIARLCKEKGAHLYLVVPPTHRLYYEHVDKAQLQMMYDALQQISIKWNNVSVLDYFDDKRFEDDDFFDVNHLSDVGAEKFTRILEKECLQ